MNKIMVYGKTFCGACSTVQAYLKSRGVEFDYINIDEDQEAQDYIFDNFMGVPVTEYKDSTVTEFEMEGLDKIIKEWDYYEKV